MCRPGVNTCAKVVYLLSNLILAVGSLAAMGFAVAVIVEIGDFMELMPANPKFIARMSIAFGILAFCSTLVALYGTIKDAQWVLLGNMIFVLGLVAVKAYIAAAIFRNLNELYTMMRVVLDAAVSNPNLPESFHLMEERFRCCGSTGADSYYDFNRPVPPSCCIEPSDGVCQPNESYLGCSLLVSDFFNDYGRIIGHIIARVAVVEVITVIAGTALINFNRIQQRQKPSVQA